MVARAASSLSAGAMSSLPQEVDANVFEEQQPEWDGRCVYVGGVGGDRATNVEHVHIGCDVRAERNVDDVADPLWRQRVHLLDQIETNVHHVMRAGILRRRVIRASSDRRDHRRARPAGELYGADSNRTGAALYQHGPSFDGTQRAHAMRRARGISRQAFRVSC